MNWNDLTEAWHRQNEPGLPEHEWISLGKTMEQRRRQMAGRFFWRDWREVWAGFVAAAFFAVQAWRQGRAGWPMAVAVVLILGVTAFFIRERFRVHRNRRGPEASLVAKLDADIAELRHQRYLLLNVGKRYLGPLGAAWAIMVIATMVHAPAHVARHRGFLEIYVVLCVLLAWGILRLNRRASRRKIEPLLAELERMRNGLSRSE